MTLLFVALLAAAALSTLVGQGGGIFYTPLQLWMGIPFQRAAATSLVLVMTVSVSASLVFRRARRVDWRLVGQVEPPTVVGGFAGGFVSHAVPERTLVLLLGAVLVLAAPLLLGAPRLRQSQAGHFAPARRRHSWSGRLALVLVMFCVGALTGALGIGGGVLKVAVMILLLGVPTEVAVGSSAVMVGLTAAAGVAGHASVGHLEWTSAGVLAAAVFAGAQVGSRLSLVLPTARLRQALGGVQFGVGVFLLVEALR